MTNLDRYPEPMQPVHLARHWRVSPDTIIRLFEAGQVKGAFRVGKQWRIRKADVLAYENGGGETEPGAFHVERKPPH